MAIKKLPSTGDVPRSTGVPDSLKPGGATDSGGYPWAGRTFDHHGTAFEGDDGATPKEWAAAVGRLRDLAAQARAAETADAYWKAADEVAEAHADALAVLSRQRLLVPLVTEAGDLGVTPEGRTVEKTQELSMVTVAAPDGRGALPTFSSVDAMRRWNPNARPIPQPAPQVAVAAAGEGTDIVMIDAGTPELEFGVRRTQLQAVALGERVLPGWADDAVAAACDASIVDEPLITAVHVAPGDLEGRLATAEVEVMLRADPQASKEELQQALKRVQQRWSVDEAITGRVDSMRVRFG